MYAGRIVVAALLAFGSLAGCGEDDNGTFPASPTSTASLTATSTVIDTSTPTLPPPTTTPTAVPATHTTTPTLIPTATATSVPPTSTATSMPSATVTSTSIPTSTATNSASATPTLTASPSPTHTLGSGPLGPRHFVLNPSKSHFQVLLAGNAAVINKPIQGQTDGQVEPAFIDFDAGPPDAQGHAVLNITNTSEYFFSDARPFLVLCIKLPRQVTSAGIIDCDGGENVGTVLTQNHKVGQVGQDGFTIAQCTTMGGTVESPNEICAAPVVGDSCGANADCDTTLMSGDGVCGIGVAMCTAPPSHLGNACHNDAECDSGENAGDGTCGRSLPHPGVCNGPISATQSGDAGPGEVFIGPFSRNGVQFNGLPVELSFQTALPCSDEPAFVTPFPLSTGTFQTTILNSNAKNDNTRMYETQGTNFSCNDWQNPTGPGRFVLTAPQLDVPMAGDIITVFTLDGSPDAPTPTPTSNPMP